MNHQTCAANDTGMAVITNPVAQLGRLSHLFAAARIGIGSCVGVIFLLGLLAAAASVPILNVLVLGYLLETQARVARTGKLRCGLFLLPEAQRLGTILLGVVLWLIPVQLVATLARDSQFLAPSSYVPMLWKLLLLVTVVLIAIHLILAIGCGGRWWQFFRPVRNARRLLTRIRAGEYWQKSHQGIIEFIAEFRVLHLAKLGLLGYAAVYVWLAIPAYLFTQLEDVTDRWQIVGFVIGFATLTLALLWAPPLMVHVAVTERFSAIFEFSKVRRLTQRIPLRWTLTTALLFALSILPMLYLALLKSRIPPHSIQWDLMLVFLVTAIPPRLLMGLVYYHGKRQQSLAMEASSPSQLSLQLRLWHYTNVTALAAALGGYVYFLYLAETSGELGQRVVWQFQALLLPFPFQ